MYPPFYNRFFYYGSLWGKVFLGPSASQDVVITRFGYYVKLASKPGVLLGAKPTAWCPCKTVSALHMGKQAMALKWLNQHKRKGNSCLLFRYILLAGNLPFLVHRLLARRLLFPIVMGILKMVTHKQQK